MASRFGVVGVRLAGAHALAAGRLEQRLHPWQVRPVWLEERITDSPLELRYVAADVELHRVEDDAARQRIPVGVQSRRRDTNKDVSNGDRAAVD